MGDTMKYYTMFGLVLSIVGGMLALTRGHGARSFYAATIYHMTLRSHRAFAAVSAVFGAGFAVALRWASLTIPLLAVYLLLFILYASSFARGFSGEDE